MNTPFVKYQGTGNDFIIIDAREGIPSGMDVASLCNRHFGIGADGFMYLTRESGFDFGMVYYNSDGKVSSMCGNGGRCIAHFAHSLGIGNMGKLHFLAVDGPHDAIVFDHSVSLQMMDVQSWEIRDANTVITNTGSPHYVHFTEIHPKDRDLLEFAQKIRYGEEFAAVGINVNLVSVESDGLTMRTYERGVENETLSCGTGVTAAALSHHLLHKTQGPIKVKTPGGILSVSFEYGNEGFKNVWLEGPAEKVFSGLI